MLTVLTLSAGVVLLLALPSAHRWFVPGSARETPPGHLPPAAPSTTSEPTGLSTMPAEDAPDAPR